MLCNTCGNVDRCCGSICHESNNNCRGYWGGYHRFSLLRIIIALFLLGIVFHLGVKVGEFKEQFDGSRYFERPFNMQPMMYYRTSLPTVTPEQ